MPITNTYYYPDDFYYVQSHLIDLLNDSYR